MLKSDPSILRPSLILRLLSNGAPEFEVAPGIYEITHFGSSDFPRGYNHYPKLEGFGPYGVCDNYQQILEQCPELVNDPDRQFVITLTKIVKVLQPPDGGWRWRKWGPYIGTHKPEHEYLYDEVGIDQVYVFHIYELNRDEYK